jgi:hypothetical protein
MAGSSSGHRDETVGENAGIEERLNGSNYSYSNDNNDNSKEDEDDKAKTSNAPSPKPEAKPKAKPGIIARLGLDAPTVMAMLK